MKLSVLHTAIASLFTVLETASEGDLDANELNYIGGTIEALTILSQPNATITTEEPKKVSKKIAKKKVAKPTEKKVEKQEPEVDELDDLDLDEDDLLSSDDLDDIDLDTPEPVKAPDDVLDDLDFDLDDLTDEEDATPDDGSDPMTEQAYELLKDETKPGPALIQNKLRISKNRSTEIFEALVESGRITKAKRATPKRKSIDDLLLEIPAGDHPVVDDWFAPLTHLEADRQLVYTYGVNLKDVISMKSVRAAVKAGGNMTLVDLVSANSDKMKDLEVANPITDFSSTPEGLKYAKLIKSANEVLGDEGKLYDHMTRHGCNKATLRDLRDIAVAVKGAA